MERQDPLWTRGVPFVERVRLLAQRYALVMRPWEASMQGAGVGWDEAEVERTLAALEARLEALDEAAPEGLSASAQGVHERLEALCAACGVGGVARWAFEVMLALSWVPELRTWGAQELGVRRDDVPLTFVADVVDPSGLMQAQVRRALGALGPLQRLGLATSVQTQGVTAVSVTERALAWVGGLPMAPPRGLVLGGHTFLKPGLIAPQVPDLRARLERARRGRRPLCVVAPEGGGALTMARTLAQASGCALYRVNVATLSAARDAAWLAQARLALRLDDAALFVEGLEVLADQAPARLEAWLEVLEEAPFVRVVRLEPGGDVRRSSRWVERLGGVPLRLERLGVEARLEVWAETVARAQAEVEPGAVAFVGRAFSLGPEQIEDALALAQTRAQERSLKAARLDRASLQSACRQTADHALRRTATHITPTMTWAQVVLDPKTRAAVETILAAGRHQDTVMDTWGFGRLMGYGRGLTMMFSGPSGTGKTMVASLIAQELGLELYRVDPSMVVSKYIGETEQRLSDLFEQAEVTGAALFFDEADALFGKRSEVKSSNDRYANLEVNYLLQRLERFEGMVVIATNLLQSIDEAFLRRIRFKVHFGKPTEVERARLWEVMLPPELPRAERLDLKRLAKTYALTGGEIRNVALRAAVFAVQAGGGLRMRHLIDAANVAYQEQGRLPPA